MKIFKKLRFFLISRHGNYVISKPFFKNWFPCALYPCTASYRIFAAQKYATLLKDTTRHPCRALKDISRATCNEHEVRKCPRRNFVRLDKWKNGWAVFRLSTLKSISGSIRLRFFENFSLRQLYPRIGELPHICFTHSISSVQRKLPYFTKVKTRGCFAKNERSVIVSKRSFERNLEIYSTSGG